MPLPLTVSCFSKIQIGFTFLVPAHLGSPGKRAVKRVCVCVCVWLGKECMTCEPIAGPKIMVVKHWTSLYLTIEAAVILVKWKMTPINGLFYSMTWVSLLLLSSSVFTIWVSLAIQWQRRQMCAVTAAHSPALSVGSCWQYVTSFVVCHKDICQLLQGPTFLMGQVSQ